MLFRLWIKKIGIKGSNKISGNFENVKKPASFEDAGL